MSAKKPDLWGNEFLDALAAAGDASALEILWRAAEPGLALRLVPRLAAARKPGLAALLLDEYVKGRFDQQVRGAILMAAQSPSPPILSAKDASRLVQFLRDQTSLPNGQWPPGRQAGERWALAQEASDVDAFARDVAAQDAPSTWQEPVRLAAWSRAGRVPDVADAVASRIAEKLAKEHSEPALDRAVGFLDRLPSGWTSDAVNALVDAVIEWVGGMAQRPIPESVVRRIAGSPQRLAARLARNVGQGGPTLVQAIEYVASADDRGTLTAIVVLRQPNLANGISTQRWTAKEWEHRLGGVVAAEPASSVTQVFVAFLSRAPGDQTPQVMRAAARHGAPALEPLRKVAVDKAHARVEELIAGRLSTKAVAALAWPEAGDDYLVPLAKAVLKSSVASSVRGMLIGEAVAEGSLKPEVAHVLVEPSEYAAILAAPDLTDDRRAVLAACLYDAAPDAMSNVIRKNQTDSFSMEIAAAIAPRNAEAAFAGGAAAYERLGNAERDRLFDLFEAHGTWKQEELLSAFADTSKAAAPRRVRAVTLAARLAPHRSAVPPFITAAVGTGRLDLKTATFATIATLEPRDLGLARSMRDVAESTGALGQAAARASLEALATAYANQLGDATTLDERRLLLSLLGATARTTAIDVLLTYVGGEAEDDHPVLKQAAAAALDDAAAVVRFTPQQIDQLGDRIDGPQPEGDPKTRETLANALGKATLGEDQALLVLTDMIGRSLKASPDQLFGAEKPRLLRAAALYKTHDSLGEAGWPGVVQQLDIMAMCVVRAAYLVAGDSEPNKQLIRTLPEKPDYGGLLNMLGGPFTNAKGALLELHRLRSQETEMPHPGTKPTQQTVTSARTNFTNGVKIVVGILENASVKRSAKKP